MNNRERLLAITSGRSPDAIPWIPRLTIWYEAHRQRGTLPERYRGWSLREIERDLGLGTPARDGRVFRARMHNVQTRIQELGSEIRTEYITPVGTVSTLHRRSGVLTRGGIATIMQTEHAIKGTEDYAPVMYMVENTEIIPTYEEYLVYEETIGEDGVPMVSIGPDPMYQILREYIGFNNAFYHLQDYPEHVSRLLEALRERVARIQQVALDSPAKLILHGEHFDSQMTPPYLFERYMLPHFRPFADRLHERGKILICHADADTSLLLDLIVEAGFDMAECFVTSPMVPVTLQQARATLGTGVIIWGGIPSVMLCDPVSDQEFEDYMLDLFRTIAPGDAFILGVADNVMAEAKIERIARVTEMVREHGQYPVRVS